MALLAGTNDLTAVHTVHVQYAAKGREIIVRIVMSASTGVPLYEQIVEQAREQILSGELPAGAALPSLRTLAAELRVSLITTTRAYNELAAAGLIINVPGKGSFVARLDRAEIKRGALEHARADIQRVVTSARSTGLITLEELTSMIREEWNR